MQSQSIRRRENTRERLIFESARVFATLGVAGATIDDLVEAAEFTRGAFYSNFNSKDELFEASLVGFSEHLTGLLQQAIAQMPRNTSVEESVRAVLAAIRPVGTIWALLESEATRRALFDEGARSCRLTARNVLKQEIVKALVANHTDDSLSTNPQAGNELAQILLNLYAEAILTERLEGSDQSEMLVRVVPPLLVAFFGKP